MQESKGSKKTLIIGVTVAVILLCVVIFVIPKGSKRSREIIGTWEYGSMYWNFYKNGNVETGDLLDKATLSYRIDENDDLVIMFADGEQVLHSVDTQEEAFERGDNYYLDKNILVIFRETYRKME